MLLLLACTENNVGALDPALELDVSRLDFGEVVIGTQVSLTFKAHNSGRGKLDIERVDLSSDTPATFKVTDPGAAQVDVGDAAEITVRFAPESVGQAFGTLQIVSDDPDRPMVQVPMEGEGVEPQAEIEPSTLWFGDVAVGASKTLSFDVGAKGASFLKVEAMSFRADEGKVFTTTLPEGVTLPHRLDAGNFITVDVTLTPTDLTPWDGALLVATNDPDEPASTVRLLGNSEEAAGPPTVEILTPDYGNFFMEGDSVRLSGQTLDQGDAPEDLLVAWYANGKRLDNVTPDAEGKVELITTALPVGDVQITLRAVDSEGNTADDQVDVKVFEQDEPVLYTISGGESVFDWWSVDDDVTITLDGTPIFSDSSHWPDTHPPVEFEAKKGQTLRIVANDYLYCARVLDALWLHWGTEHKQQLTEAVCLSACEEDACYDASYEGPWPNIFVDESAVISIP